MDQKIIEGIKNCLFGYLEDSSSRIALQMSRDEFDAVINDAVESCYDGIVAIGGNGDDDITTTTKAASISVLATGLLHYLSHCIVDYQSKKDRLQRLCHRYRNS